MDYKNEIIRMLALANEEVLKAVYFFLIGIL